MKVLLLRHRIRKQAYDDNNGLLPVGTVTATSTFEGETSEKATATITAETVKPTVEYKVKVNGKRSSDRNKW